MAQIEYELVRSRRKTLGMQLKPDGTLVVRAPLRTSRAVIDRYVDGNLDWVHRARARVEASRRQAVEAGLLTQAELDRLTRKANRIIPERVRHYAPLVGVTYGRITIRHQKTRWGSCTAQGNLNFNCLLMLAPPEVIDSVVVHELCHRLEMNHSKRFYAQVLRVYPDYYRCHDWLKVHGRTILQRMIANE